MEQNAEKWHQNKNTSGQAVLTGDLIRSTSAKDSASYLNSLSQILAEIAEYRKGSFDIFRGDGFQVVPRNAQDSFKWAILIRAGLIGERPNGEQWDARIAIAISHPHNKENLEDTFIMSGRTLDRMKSRSANLIVVSKIPSLVAKLGLATELVSSIIDSWTPVEAKTYYTHTLFEMVDHRATANALKKDRTTVVKALKRARAGIVDRFLEESALSIKDVVNADHNGTAL